MSAAGVETKMNMAQTNLSRRDSLKIARRFNAGIGLDCASSPGGTAENARPFRPSLRDPVPMASQGTSDISLTPWLQPGVKRDTRIENRFNGFSSGGEAVETAGVYRRGRFTGLKPRC